MKEIILGMGIIIAEKVRRMRRGIDEKLDSKSGFRTY